MGNPRGDGYAADGETPVHEVTLSPFHISPTAVTNDEFARFVKETGHRTDAERFGWSFVFAGHLPPDLQGGQRPVNAPWWRQVFGADWAHPEGPDSDIRTRRDYPVVHVSWADAVSYCQWAGVRLLTEAEWEYAARGGRVGQRFPWGDDLEPRGKHRMNVFQGTFPERDAGADGFRGTAPVDAFKGNGFGLWNMTGNVWEWCADWFSPTTYQRGPVTDPAGPATGEARVMRGGSFLCHASYCNRYRVDARSSNTPDSSTANCGFRVAWS